LKNPEGVLEPLSAADKVLAKLAEAKNQEGLINFYL
jgi:hypothetical protein